MNEISTAEIKRVFWKDAAICNSYSIGNFTSVAVMECGSKKQVLKSAVLARSAVRQACVKSVAGKAVKTLASIQLLCALRPVVPLSVAMAGSAATAVILGAAPCSPNVKPAVAAVKVLSAALVAAAQCSAEYSLYVEAKNVMRKKGFTAGSSRDMTIAFMAGCVATAASNVAVSLLPGRALGAHAMKKLGASAAAGGVGYAAMDKTFQVLYLPNKKALAGGALSASRCAAPAEPSASLALAAMEEPMAVVPLGLRVALPTTRKSPLKRNVKVLGASSKPRANAFTEVTSAINARDNPKCLPKAAGGVVGVKAPLRLTAAPHQHGRRSFDRRTFSKLPKSRSYSKLPKA